MPRPTSLPFPDGAYDVVLCQMGLMFMQDRRAAVAEMRRVTAPGGRVVVNTPGPIQPLFALMEQALVEHISADLGGFVRAVFSIDDPAELASLLRDAGLVDVTAEASSAPLELGEPAEFLWEYINLTPMGAFVAQAPARAKDTMERQVVTSWQPFIVDEAMSISQPMVIASGRTPIRSPTTA
jgi:SAM-dependent methyltransferase